MEEEQEGEEVLEIQSTRPLNEEIKHTCGSMNKGFHTKKKW